MLYIAPSSDRSLEQNLFLPNEAYVGGIVGPHYAASKAGLLGLTHWIASNYAKSGITANCVVPALIEATTMLPTDIGNFAQRSFSFFCTLFEC